MKNIVICATQRCGSTMIIEDMRNTSVMGQPAEWFIPWTSPIRDDGKDWAKAFKAIQKRATGPDGRSAIKIMANQVASVDERLSKFVTPTHQGIYPAFAEMFSDHAWIRLIRRDIVSQAISRVMSLQTGIMHATKHKKDDHFAGRLQKGYDPDYNRDVVYNYDLILRNLQSIVLENLAWDRFFESNGIETTELYYEDIIADPDMKHLDVIAQKANIPTKFEKHPRKLTKMANNRNIEWRDAFFSDLISKKFKGN